MTNRTRFELLVLSLVLIAAAIYLKPNAATDAATFAPLLRRVTPAVVNVAATADTDTSATARRRFDPSSKPHDSQSIGSGFVIDGDHGLIVTNHHVVQNAARIAVTLADRRQFDAAVIASDPDTDLAVLAVDATDLVALSFGDSDELEVGDFVIAIGNPFGLGQTATSGIVSALGRSGMNLEGYEDFIQTDAAINPGSSGGPLVDADGRLVGINTAILSPAGGNVGIGFAIPSNMAREVVLQLIEHGAVRRGRLGITMQDVTPPLSEALGLSLDRGALVTSVEARSPAALAGIVAGDIVAAIDGFDIHTSTDLRNRIGMVRVGEAVALDVIHDGVTRSVHAQVAALAPRTVDVGATIGALAGAAFTDVAVGATRRELAADGLGAFVAAVEHGSPAWHRGLAANDIVVAVNRRPIASAIELADAVRATTTDAIALHVVRGGRRIFLLIR